MIQILIVLILLGLILYIVQLLPIDATIKKVIIAVAVVLVLIWVIEMIAGGTLTAPFFPPLRR